MLSFYLSHGYIWRVKYMEWLSFFANIAQIIGTGWVIIFGGKAIYDVLKQLRTNAQAGKSTKLGSLLHLIGGVTGTNILLALILITLLALTPITTFLHIPAAAARTKITPQTPTTLFPSYIPGRGTLVINDPMIDNSHGNQWQEVTTDIHSNDSNPGSCQFAADGYHIQADNNYYSCLALAQQDDLINFVFEAQMRPLPKSAGGLSIRNTAGGAGYDIDVGPSGNYSISNPKNVFLRGRTFSPLILRNQATYLVDIAALGNQITLYVNKKRIDSVIDSTSSHGYIGLYVTTDGGMLQTEVTFTNVKVWSFT